jgi:hypothetical protein
MISYAPVRRSCEALSAGRVGLMRGSMPLG